MLEINNEEIFKFHKISLLFSLEE
ncbi:unknown protein [Simkania negevensis Z]|uniref:Uncharacterized protein n=1 Tax=Simkania negevensis (strain ATCC VR-1471 / DSM 27360 / Z) TaxID=331113 RepID=F8L762_SIMNZ|nr:unknown protein [Simkania negevensis Z]